MKCIAFLAAAVALSAATAQQPAPAADRARLLVTPQWLSAHLNDPNLVILTIGEESTFKAKHIGRAQFVSLRDISAPRPPTLEMPSPNALRETLTRYGISDNSRIIIYQSDEYVSPSTRVALTLEYAGLGANMSILDGGLDAWEKAGLATTTEVFTPKPGTLSPLVVHRVVVDANYVRDHVGKAGFAVVDGRDAATFDALDSHGNMHGRRGHIAGAHSVPFESLYASDNTLLPSTDLQRIFQKAGVQPGDTIVGYCWIGQFATAMLFGARAAGHPVLLFDGSWEDWGARDSTYAVSTQPARRDP